MVPAEVLGEVRRIHIRTRRLVDGMFAGEYHSVFKGRGMEFAEVREYEPGDDVRTIDWNVTARLGHPYVKRHVEERELTVMLLVDVSASGQFGSVARLKAEIAAEVAAVLALSAVTNSDRVGLILFSDRIEKVVPPQKGRNRALRIVLEMLRYEPAGRGTDIGLALSYFSKTTIRRAIAFLISDFLASGYETPLRIAVRGHDIVPICISDRREFELPEVGLVRLQDLETGQPVLVDTGSAALRRAYRRRREEAVAERRRLFRGLGIEEISITTDEPYGRPLMRFFAQRERRLGQQR